MSFCEHCGVDGDGNFCAACGKPRKSQSPAARVAASLPAGPTVAARVPQQPRKISVRLGIAIFLAPFIFAWFTLRNGYSALSRGIAFGWMVLLFILPGLAADAGRPYGVHERPAKSTVAAEPNRDQAPVVAAAMPACPSGTTLAHRIDPKTGAAQPYCATEEKAAPPDEIKVDAVRLWRDYQANEVAADRHYKGKSLLVSGKVASIDKGPFGGIYVMLRSPNEFMNVHAKMDSSQEGQASSLTKGQAISLRCQATGMTIGSPTLDDCVFP